MYIFSEKNFTLQVSKVVLNIYGGICVLFIYLVFLVLMLVG